MEPVTHILTGACLARSGLNRRAAYATAAMAVAAEFPDIDTLWSLRGPVSGFEHHRGITHTFLGLPFEAALLLLIFWLVHRLRSRQQSTRSKPLTTAPVRWGNLYGLLLLALCSHILLDYTNNYGVRPFFPFNPHWYAASLVFIFDPLLFTLLVAGLALPRLFALVAEEVGTRRQRFRGAGWARAALIGVVSLWLVRGVQHAKALTLAMAQVAQAPESSSASGSEEGDVQAVPRVLLQPRRSLASPDPLSIFRWYTASDFGPMYTLATADTWAGGLTPDRTLTKAATSPALDAAKRSHLGRVYLDWSTMPWLSVSSGDIASSATQDVPVTVTFQDLRFMGSTSLLRRQGHTPLTGTVTLDRVGSVLDEALDGRSERSGR